MGFFIPKIRYPEVKRTPTRRRSKRSTMEEMEAISTMKAMEAISTI